MRNRNIATISSLGFARSVRGAALSVSLALAFGLAGSGCKDTTGPETDPEPEWSGTMFARVSGREFTPATDHVFAASGQLSGETFIHVVGAVPSGNDEGESIALSFRPGTGAHTVEFGPGRMDGAAYANWISQDDSQFYLTGVQGGSGRIVLSENSSNHIEGTFVFTGVDSLDHDSRISVTDGRFSLTRNR